MFNAVADVVNVLVVRLLLDIVPVVEIIPVAVISTTLSMLLKGMSRSLVIATYEDVTSIMILSSSSSNRVTFDSNVSHDPSAVNLSTGSVVAISNVNCTVEWQ